MREKVLFLVALVLVLPVATVVAFHPNTDCDSCHLPHEDGANGSGGLAGMPLWNGTRTAASTFTNYDSPTLDAAAGDPEGPTLVCLACHDGSHGAGLNITGGPGDLGGSHPMEFVYDGALATSDGELYDPDTVGSSTVVGGDGTITADLLNAGTKKVNCQSCHEIHSNGLHSEVIDPPDPLLGDLSFDIPHLVDIPGTAMELGRGGDPNLAADYELSYAVLCRTCHNK
ncbi:MAG: hypothetical protein ACYSWP_13595 [Planctomycetota bacterium]